jgi:adenosylcobinamide-GDP ribazoletransferase
MGEQIRLFLCALGLLTRIPVPPAADFEPGRLARASRYYPLVGQLVGVFSALVYLAAVQLLPTVMAALLAVAAGTLITGALHEDGLADTADGLGGGRDRDQRLAIMKDSRIGTYGALALGLTTALKVAALAGLPPALAPAALVAGHGIARAANVIAMRLPYAGAPGGGKLELAGHAPTLGETALAMALAAWPLLFLPIAGWAAGLLAAACVAVLLALAARRLIGGWTGDVLGAIEQGVEALFLVGMLAAAGIAVP